MEVFDAICIKKECFINAHDWCFSKQHTHKMHQLRCTQVISILQNEYNWIAFCFVLYFISLFFVLVLDLNSHLLKHTISVLSASFHVSCVAAFFIHTYFSFCEIIFVFGAVSFVLQFQPVLVFNIFLFSVLLPPITRVQSPTYNAYT